MELELIAKLGAGLVVAALFAYAVIKVVQLAQRAVAAEALAARATVANEALADALDKQQVALERNRKYARLLENQVIENAGPAELVSVFNKLFSPTAPTDNNDPK